MSEERRSFVADTTKTLGAGWKSAKSLLKGRRASKKQVRGPQGPQRRHLPAQAGTQKDRRDVDALARLENESVESVIEEGLWKHHWLLPPVAHSLRYQRFHALLRALLYYNSFWLPLRISFFPMLDSTAWLVMDVIEYVIDAAFWLDILMALRTAGFESNELITDPGEIARRYLRFWFWVDAGATFPWEAVTGIVYFKAVRLARCFRLYKLHKGRAIASGVWRRLAVIVVRARGSAPRPSRLLRMPACNALRVAPLPLPPHPYLKRPLLAPTLTTTTASFPRDPCLAPPRRPPCPRSPQFLIVFLCHWIACIWWIVGTAQFNLRADFGYSWIFRHRSDGYCDRLPNTTHHRAAAVDVSVRAPRATPFSPAHTLPMRTSLD